LDDIHENLRGGVDGSFSVASSIWIKRLDYRFDQPRKIRLDNQRTLGTTSESSGTLPLSEIVKFTFRIKNASICINDFLCCTSVTCKISIESVVITSGVLLDVICRTALLAAKPTFKVVIPSFFVCVARLNNDRRRPMTST
jgi:hypothetical protein